MEVWYGTQRLVLEARHASVEEAASEWLWTASGGRRLTARRWGGRALRMVYLRY